MAELLDDVPDRVVAVYAHPDDADVSCGGTIARWAGAGSEVHVVVCTDGDKGTTDAHVDPAELAGRRAAELAASAEVLGVAGSERLHYPDGELDDGAALRSVLVGVIRRLRPDLVLCPDPTAIFFGQDYFNHRDHRATGWAALDAASPAAALPHYVPAAGPAHQVSTVLLSGTLEPDVWVDISATLAVKEAAVTCHRSQFSDGGEWARTAVRLGAEDAGRRCGRTYAEGFRRLRLGG